MNTHNTYPSWTTTRKIIFRFLFIFLLLEIVLALDWIAIACGFDLSIVYWEHKIYTPTFLWLNKAFFQFHYNPIGAHTLTPSLIVVRFITYVTIASVGCLIWTFADHKRLDYNKLEFWFSQFLFIYLSCIMWAYGILKVFYVQMPMPVFADLHTPIGNMHPTALLWAGFGIGTPYQIFIGMGEAVAAVLLLFNRTRLFSLIITTFILLNVAVMNYTYSIGIFGFALFLLLITTYLLSRHATTLWVLLFQGHVTAMQETPKYQFTTRWKKFATLVLFVAPVIASYAINISRTYDRNSRRRMAREATQYFEVKHFILNEDTLKLTLNDTVRWRFWEENTRSKVSTIHTMDYTSQQRFSIDRDTVLKQITLHPFDTDTTSLHFSYVVTTNDQWQLSGVIDGKRMSASLKRIHPYTTEKLFMEKRSLIPIDPEKW